MNDLIAKIAFDFGVKITDCREVEYYLLCGMPPEYFENDSYVIGPTDIILGKYTGNDELRIAALLHEIGHLCGADNFFLSEREAWDAAEKLAIQYNILWTSTMADYRKQCLDTYMRHHL